MEPLNRIFHFTYTSRSDNGRSHLNDVEVVAPCEDVARRAAGEYAGQTDLRLLKVDTVSPDAAFIRLSSFGGVIAPEVFCAPEPNAPETDEWADD